MDLWAFLYMTGSDYSRLLERRIVRTKLGGLKILRTKAMRSGISRVDGKYLVTG